MWTASSRPCWGTCLEGGPGRNAASEASPDACSLGDPPLIVTLLTDYGHNDDFVGVCHGVIRSISPDTPIVDITHGIPRHGVRQGAIVLRNALPYMPVGVHVAVVDPQVGTARRALALRWQRRHR